MSTWPGGCAADRRPAADAPDAGRRVAVGAADVAAGGKLVCDDGTDDDSIRDEAGVRRVWPTVARSVPGLEYGWRVFVVVFAKTELAGGQNCVDLVTV